jgi:hypothetical protein
MTKNIFLQAELIFDKVSTSEWERRGEDERKYRYVTLHH